MAQASNIARLQDDPYLAPYLDTIRRRAGAAEALARRLSQGPGSLP